MSEDALSGLQPVATGDLAETPFGHLVLYIHRSSQTGTLALTDPRGGESRVLFQDGKAFAAELPWDAASLLEGLVPLCGLPGGKYAFYSEIVELASPLSGELNPYALIGASIDRYVRADAVETTVTTFASTRLRLARAQRIRDLGLTASDRPLLDLIRAEPASPERLLQICPLPKERIERVLYALLISNALAPYDTQELEDHHKRVQGSYVIATAQGGPQRSSSEQGGSGPTPVRTTLQGASAPTAAPSEATFTHANRAASPSTSFASSKGAVRSAPTGDASELNRALAEAERAFKQGKHAEALFPLARLTRKHAHSADLHALQAVIMFDRDVAANEPVPEHIVALIDEALALDPDQARALYLKGMQLKRSGQPSKAASYFERAVEEDPNNIAAKRELHLLRKG